MEWQIGFFLLIGVVIILQVLKAIRAGPRQLSGSALERAHVLVRSTPDRPKPGWSELGSRTTADGLRLRFDADDDPQAEAKFLVPRHEAGRNRFGHSRAIKLSSEFQTEHVHTSRYVFRMRLRGTGTTVGKQVEIKMLVGSNGKPYGGVIENDDDHDPAMGDWIEFEFVEIVRVR